MSDKKKEKVTIVYGWDEEGKAHIVDDSQLNNIKDQETKETLKKVAGDTLSSATYGGSKLLEGIEVKGAAKYFKDFANIKYTAISLFVDGSLRYQAEKDKGTLNPATVAGVQTAGGWAFFEIGAAAGGGLAVILGGVIAVPLTAVATGLVMYHIYDDVKINGDKSISEHLGDLSRDAAQDFRDWRENAAQNVEMQEKPLSGDRISGSFEAFIVTKQADSLTESNLVLGIDKSRKYVPFIEQKQSGDRSFIAGDPTDNVKDIIKFYDSYLPGYADRFAEHESDSVRDSVVFLHKKRDSYVDQTSEESAGGLFDYFSIGNGLWTPALDKEEIKSSGKYERVVESEDLSKVHWVSKESGDKVLTEKSGAEPLKGGIYLFKGNIGDNDEHVAQHLGISKDRIIENYSSESFLNPTASPSFTIIKDGSKLKGNDRVDLSLALGEFFDSAKAFTKDTIKTFFESRITSERAFEEQKLKSIIDHELRYENEKFIKGREFLKEECNTRRTESLLDLEQNVKNEKKFKEQELLKKWNSHVKEQADEKVLEIHTRYNALQDQVNKEVNQKLQLEQENLARKHGVKINGDKVSGYQKNLGHFSNEMRQSKARITEEYETKIQELKNSKNEEIALSQKPFVENAQAGFNEEWSNYNEQLNDKKSLDAAGAISSAHHKCGEDRANLLNLVRQEFSTKKQSIEEKISGFAQETQKKISNILDSIFVDSDKKQTFSSFNNDDNSGSGDNNFHGTPIHDFYNFDSFSKQRDTIFDDFHIPDPIYMYRPITSDFEIRRQIDEIKREYKNDVLSALRSGRSIFMPNMQSYLSKLSTTLSSNSFSAFGSDFGSFGTFLPTGMYTQELGSELKNGFREALQEARYSSSVIKQSLSYAESHVSPLVLDLNNDGIKLHSFKDGVYFDIDNDKFMEKIGWASAEDGQLAIDLSGNGIIDNITELFGDDLISAFFKLRLLDSNSDGTIDKQDLDFDKLLIWQDLNKNGFSEFRELKSLKEHSIASISLATKPDDRNIEGNLVSATSVFTREDGSQGEVADVHYHNDDLDSWYVGGIFDDIVKINPEVLLLPLSRGYGKIPALHIAMSQNPVLLDMVRKFSLLLPKDLAAFSSDIQDIIYEWAGVSKTDRDLSEISGLNIEAKKVAFVEQFTGQEFKQMGIADFVGQHASTSIQEAWNYILVNITEKLLVQGPLSEIFSNAQYDFSQDKMILNENFDSIIKKAKKTSIEYKLDQGFWISIGYILSNHLNELSISIVDLRSVLSNEAGEEIYIGEGSFLLIGDSKDNIIYGSDSNDHIKGEEGNDRLFGKQESDYVEGGDGNDYIEGNEGIDRLYGNDGNDEIHGGAGRDFIYGGAGKDTIYGEGEDDNIEGGEDADQLDGGDGNDTLSYGSSKEGVKVNLATKETSGGDAQGDQISNFENIGGSEENDILIGDESSNVINGEGGDDEIHGGPGDDRLFGATGNDKLYGDDGDDSFTGFRGLDFFEGGNGTDTVYYSHPYSLEGVKVDLNKGIGIGGFAQGDKYSSIENIVGSRHNDIIVGDDQNNRLVGGRGNDYIEGGDGNDIIINYSGDNTVLAGNGDDQIFPGSGDEHIDGGEGNDLVTYERWKFDGAVIIDLSRGLTISGINRSHVYISIENLVGTKGDDTIIGDSRDNRIYGDDGNDIIQGGDGNDVMSGGKGDDKLHGEAGNDIFLFSPGVDIFNGGAGKDRVDYGHALGPIYINMTVGFGKENEAAGDQYIDIEDIIGSKNNDVLIGDKKANYLNGGDGDDEIYGEGGNDVLVGGKGRNTLNGGHGNDVFIGGEGQDNIDGVSGHDFVIYKYSKDAVVVNLQLGSGQKGDAEGDTYKNIIGVIGSENDDELIGDSNANTIKGMDGNDVISANDGNDKIYGGKGENILDGCKGDDEFFVSEGTNQIDGGEGQDTLNYFQYRQDEYIKLLTEHNLYNGEKALPSFLGEEYKFSHIDKNGLKINLATNSVLKGDLKDSFTNIENIVGSNFDDVLSGNERDNVLETLDGIDWVYAGLGNDTIASNLGISFLYGEEGNDLFIISNSRGIINGGAGLDTVDYSNLNYGIYIDLEEGFVVKDQKIDRLVSIESIIMTNEHDTLYDNDNDNFIRAESGDDVVYISHGKDVVWLGDGNDTIHIFGINNKLLFGQAGSDHFIFYNSIKTEDTLGSIIADFDIYKQGEKIDLTDFVHIKSMQDLILKSVMEDGIKYLKVIISDNQYFSLRGLDTDSLSDYHFDFYSFESELILDLIQ